MIDFIDKTSEQNGTPINRENLMALQGFENNNVDIVENGNITTITETNNDNHTLTTVVTENEDGSTTIVETFIGEKTITKTSTINADGTQINGRVD